MSELSLEPNETAYVDGGIATILPSSSSIPVAIDTSKLHAARIKRFKSNACTGVIADFTSCRTNSDDVPTPPELAQSSDLVLQDGDENLSYRHSNSKGVTPQIRSGILHAVNPFLKDLPSW
ncbi:hypothetical protein OROMI_017141 [Orobanche minor]